MSFRKRNTVIGISGAAPELQQKKVSIPGTRPSPHDGRLTTSTGTLSLDQLLAGHAGLPVGTSLLLEESGTTDFGGILLRYFAAEGLVQGHSVHVLGFGDHWRRELPGLAAEGRSKESKSSGASGSKMKIAWRYETLGSRAAPSRGPSISDSTEGMAPFCHTFDLSARLDDSVAQGQFHTTRSIGMDPSQSLFRRFINDVTSRIKSSPPTSIHRLVIPSLLSPTIYPPSASRPQEVLQFLHQIRALLRQYPFRIVAMMTLPTSLYPRSTGLIRRAELICDGVLELIPLQQQPHHPPERSSANDTKAQGLFRIHSLPIFHEKGGGLEGSWVKEDMSFKLSASSGLVIAPYSLPPVLDEEGPSNAPANENKPKLDF
ncbi:Elongator complex protein 4 [Trichoderma longibrachiatum]|uniref:Elongator complex protein 4 n=1 Tax=Trichoderma longibrachiatum ATCC 18648 TaxID=983965 RepID=A0A2T4CGX0_TRILO|nr:PAXNEB-domain-containing protein [Trichoderma longibrachiatum ATCC 18648]